MMWIGLVAHEPRKFSSQMFCYQICVASMELDSTPSTNTRMGPWRNATPNKSRQTSYYASLSQLSITESGSHQTNVLIATAMIWICYPQKLKLLQNTFWKYDTLTEWMQILSTIVAGLAWVWRRVFIQCQCLLKARDPSTENCRTSDPKSYSKQSGKKHFNFAPNEKTRVYCCLIYNVNNIIQQHVGKRMCFPLQKKFCECLFAFTGSLGRLDIAYSSRELGVRSPKSPQPPWGGCFSKARLKAAVVSLKHMGCAWSRRPGKYWDIIETKSVYACLCVFFGGKTCQLITCHVSWVLAWFLQVLLYLAALC